jgi:hypothetical protein
LILGHEAQVILVAGLRDDGDLVAGCWPTLELLYQNFIRISVCICEFEMERLPGNTMKREMNCSVQPGKIINPLIELLGYTNGSS